MSEFTPTRCPIRTTAAFSDSSGSSFRASATSLIARSRSSGGYFLGAGIVIILSGNQTLHETRGDSIAAGGPDGLIDPAAWPIRAEDLADTTGYELAAATLRRITADVDARALDLGGTWNALSGAYQAPELEQALAIMPPVLETATGVATDLAAAAGALEGLATALQGIHPRLADLQARAERFRADVIGGVLTERVSVGGPAPGDYLGRLDMVRDVNLVDLVGAQVPWLGLGGGPELVPWNQHRASVARNAELCTEYAVLYEEITTVVAECVNTVDARNPEHTGPPLEPLPAGALLDPGNRMPWGAPVAEDRHWVEQLLTGVDDTGRVLVNEGARLAFGYDIHSGEFGRHVSDQALVETVSGALELGIALSLDAMMTRADGRDVLSAVLAVTPEPARRWANDRYLDGMTTVAGLAGLVHGGPDPFRRWRDDGLYTLGSTLTNVGSMASPSALGIAAGMGRASRIARLAELAGTTPEAIHAGRVVDGDGLMWRDPDAPPPHTATERATLTPGDGEVVFNSRGLELPELELAQWRRYTDTLNDVRLDGELSATGRVSTGGHLRADARAAAPLERQIAETAGRPYEGVVGHAPDTTWTGWPVPREWHDQSMRVNSSLGGTASRYPVGFRPRIFRLLLPDGSYFPPTGGG